MKKTRIITEAERYFEDVESDEMVELEEDLGALNEESKTVKINGLEWMTTNLGDVGAVPLIEDDEEWEKVVRKGKPACCYYNNQRGKGVLYNWFALKHLEKGGWRIPTDEEWKTLPKDKQEFIDLGWNPQYGGYRDREGNFYDVGYSGHWWSATEYDTSRAWTRYLYYDEGNLYRSDNNKGWGFSVRLVK